jgi:FdhD protein
MLKPKLSHASRPLTFAVDALNERGELLPTSIAGEHPLTLYVDKREIVTLMTLGQAPEALAIGYLRNQRLVRSIDELAEVQVDWETDAVRRHETIYKSAGAVHGCALADGSDILYFVEDVGRHNAVDAIAGRMWLDDIDGSDKIFYTTGRLTSEMVIKAAQMRVPFLVSRSGLTKMGYDIALRIGITMLGRAVNQRYLLFTGRERFVKTVGPTMLA